MRIDKLKKRCFAQESELSAKERLGVKCKEEKEENL